MHVLKSSRFSGAEHVVTDIIKSMPELDSYYVSCRGGIEEVLRKKHIQYRLVDKFTVFSLSEIIREIKPDIIHAHDFTAGVCTALCFTGKPVISHLHNNVPWMRRICIRSTVYFFSTFFYRKILTVSQSVLNEYVFGRAARKKSCVIGNPVNISEIQKKADRGKDEGCWDIVFVGRLSGQKNLPLLLEIMEQLSERGLNFSFVIVGEGEEEDYLRNEIERRKLKPYVTLMGFLENPYPVMKHSKILVLPSKWEGFGLVAVEALALGKPVVCSGAGGLDDIVDDTCGKKCGFDVMAYVDEIEKLLENGQYYSQKCDGAAARAGEMDNFNCYIRRIKEIYDKCEKVF